MTLPDNMQAVKWTLNDNGDWDGVGSHATYVVHQLVEKRVGVPDIRGKWLTARRLGDQPLKVIGGPYDTMELAKLRAERAESSL